LIRTFLHTILDLKKPTASTIFKVILSSIEVEDFSFKEIFEQSKFILFILSID